MLAVALNVTLDCGVPLKSSLHATDTSAGKLPPVKTPSSVSNAASRRLNDVGPLSGATHEYQTDMSAVWPAMFGSPGCPVASVLLPCTVPSGPEMSAPGEMVVGRRCSHGRTDTEREEAEADRRHQQLTCTR